MITQIATETTSPGRPAIRAAMTTKNTIASTVTINCHSTNIPEEEAASASIILVLSFHGTAIASDSAMSPVYRETVRAVTITQNEYFFFNSYHTIPPAMTTGFEPVISSLTGRCFEPH